MPGGFLFLFGTIFQNHDDTKEDNEEDVIKSVEDGEIINEPHGAEYVLLFREAETDILTQ